MNVIIEIKDPNEVQLDLICLIAIQDKIKANKQDQEEIEKIRDVMSIVKQKIQEENKS